MIIKNNDTHSEMDSKTILINNLERKVIALRLENEELVK